MTRAEKVLEIEKSKGNDYTLREIRVKLCPIDYGMMAVDQCSAENETLKFTNCLDCWDVSYE
jgi:hypothetical protein